MKTRGDKNNPEEKERKREIDGRKGKKEPFVTVDKISVQSQLSFSFFLFCFLLIGGTE
jgi:hypothetical protein